MAAEVISDPGKILSDLRARKFSPIYFLYGEEHFFIDQVSDYIEEHALNDTEKGFNQTVMYGKDADVKSLIGAARRFPMMAERQVIIVKEAQGIDDMEGLELYCEKPVPSTLLVICYKKDKLDKRTKLYKALQPHVLFESKKVSQDRMPDWITKYLVARKFSISERAARIIADSVGNDLSKVVNELQKLIIDKKDAKEISDSDVELKIGISKDFNVFELISAIAAKNAARAFLIGHHMGKSKSFSIIPVVINLNSFFNKAYITKQSNITDRNELQRKYGITWYAAGDCLAAAKRYSAEELEKCIRLMHEYDLKSKGVNNLSASGDELLKEMLVKIL
jgi:DNA polymerase-3 subunit delta